MTRIKYTLKDEGVIIIPPEKVAAAKKRIREAMHDHSIISRCKFNKSLIKAKEIIINC